MTAGAMGAKETILTDKAELLTLLQSNVARNQHYFANKVAIQELDWYVLLPCFFKIAKGFSSFRKNTSGMHAFKPPLDFIFAAGMISRQCRAKLKATQAFSTMNKSCKIC